MSPSQIPDIPPQPTKHSHVVHFYSDDSVLVDEICRVLGQALNLGQSAVVIATLEHREKIAKRIELQIPDLPTALVEGRYTALDAAETLSRFMVDGLPDPERFADILGGIISRAASVAENRSAKVVVFGEMVALLCAEGKDEAALKVEALWNELANRHPFFLYCAYPTQAVQNSSNPELVLTLCSAHTETIGGEGLARPNGEKQTSRKMGQRPTQLEAGHKWKEIEDRFRLFVEAVQDYAIFMLDPTGNVTSWNRGAARIKGYNASEIIGKNFSTFYPEEDKRAHKPEMELEVAAREGRFEDEGWRLRKDGSRFWASVIITAIRDEFGRLVGFGKVTRDITEKMQAQVELDRINQELRREILDRKLAEHRVAESEKSLRSLSLHLLRTQDEERRRIGRDLHDSLGQVLTAIKISLATLTAETSGNSARIAKCIPLADDCIREVRTISYLMYPPMLEELGLRSAIPWYLDGFAARSGIKTTFQSSTGFDRLPRDSELALFRVLQEALTNVHRHSESPVANVRLLLDGASAVLEIQDSGKGIPSRVLGESGDLPLTGVGLRGMNERMRQLGGRLDISSGSNGTTLTAVVPAVTPADEPVLAIPISA
jgi:PAS domain S-box-containing protein